MRFDPIFFWIRMGMLCVACGLSAISCQKKDSNTDEVNRNELAEYTQVVKQMVPLNQVYFNGGVDEARSSLLKEEELLNQVRARHMQVDDWSSPKRATSAGLTLTYGRLYTLEILEGNTNAASGYVEKLKNIISEDLRNGNVSSNDIVAAVSRIEPEKIPDSVHKWDAAQHGGDPKYRIDLQHVRVSNP